MHISEQFEAQGYIVIKNLFNENEIGEITAIADYIFQQWLQENSQAVIKDQLINMHSLTSPKYFQNNSSQRIKFFELVASKKLTDLLEKLFGSQIYFHNTQLFSIVRTKLSRDDSIIIKLVEIGMGFNQSWLKT